MSGMEIGEDVTALLQAWRSGDTQAKDRLFPLIYEDLRAVARRRLRGEREGHTLQPTAVVHELYLRLSRQRRPAWRSRRQLFATIPVLIRRILVDHARRRRAACRGGDEELFRVPLEAVEHLSTAAIDRSPLQDGLPALEKHDARSATVLNLHVFGGLTFSEVAQALGLGQATVYRDWNYARLWLRRWLADTGLR